MGFRLYINDDAELCCGKLFGYVGEHLQSLQYLCDIGVLDNDIEDYCGDTPYEKAELMFDCNYQIDIEVTYEQFKTFMLLYMSERYAYFCTCDITIKETINDYLAIINKTPITNVITLSWN